MRGYMFRNRWFAMLFVGMVLAGVTRLVGTETDKGAIGDATDQLVEQKAQAEEFADDIGGGSDASAEQDVSIEFTADEELIDAAQGEDPTPVDEFAQAQAAPSPDEPEVALVSPVAAEQTAPPQ